MAVVEWEFAWGSHYDWLVKRAQRGERVKALETKPSPAPGFEDIVEAFWELGTDRSVGLTLGPIPFSSISSYGERFGYVGEEFDRLCRYVRVLDSFFLDLTEKRRKRNSGNKGAR